jgi:hypothetical protein
VEVGLHTLISALDGGEQKALNPVCFTFRERAASTHWIEDWVGPCASLDMVAKIKTLLPLLGIKLVI